MRRVKNHQPTSEEKNLISRIIQKEAAKGSQYWLQRWVNERAEHLTDTLRSPLGLTDATDIEWLSPLNGDDYAEYQDEAFLERLSITPDRVTLDSFWPRHGPCWDGLGRSDRGNIVLVEAKANIPELLSVCKAGADSEKLITDSLEKTAAHYGVVFNEGWLETYYQYANRLAHLYFLRELNGIPAWLVFVYFVNDHLTNGPRSIGAWMSAIQDIHSSLGIDPERLQPYVVDLFLDVTTIPGVGKS